MEVPHRGGAIDGSPTVDGDGVIYFGSRDSTLYALYPDGTVKWTFPAGDGFECSPTIDHNGYLYIGSFDRNLYALGTGAPDVGVTSVDVPDPVVVNAACIPVATIRNFRGAEQQFEVTCVIEDDLSVFYNDTSLVTVAGGGSIDHSFTAWQVSAEIAVDYTVTVTTTLSNDENTCNNQRSIQTTSYVVPEFIRADFDLDGDVDQQDFGHLQACLSGPEVVQTDPACRDALLDEDEDVDQADFGVFQGCISGANVPPSPDCEE